MIDKKKPEIDSWVAECTSGNCRGREGCNFDIEGKECSNYTELNSYHGKRYKMIYSDTLSGLASARFSWGSYSANNYWPNDNVSYNPKYHMGYLNVTGNGVFNYTICDAVGNCTNGKKNY